jgi:hypothetical protein
MTHKASRGLRRITLGTLCLLVLPYVEAKPPDVGAYRSAPREQPHLETVHPPSLIAREEIVASGSSARRPARSAETYQTDRRGASTGQRRNRDAQQIYSRAIRVP